MYKVIDFYKSTTFAFCIKNNHVRILQRADLFNKGAAFFIKYCYKIFPHCSLAQDSPAR